jgi:hypothetical protein
VKLCLDEHYCFEIAKQLRDKGHDVCAVKERPELIGLSDVELLNRMIAEQRALLTENIADFAPIVGQATAAGESTYGIVVSSPKSMPRSLGTIGLFVDRLHELLERHPGVEDFRDHFEWLEP